MQKLSSNPITQSIAMHLSVGYDKLKENDLVKHFIGVLFGLSLIFGFLNFTTLFNIMATGLLFFSIRETMKVVSNDTDVQAIINLNYMWIVLMSIIVSYNVLSFIFGIFGGSFMFMVLNGIYLTILSRTINYLSEWMKTNATLESFNMKNINVNAHSKDKFSDQVLGQVSIVMKLYAINSKFIDTIIYYASLVISVMFEFVNSGAEFSKHLFVVLIAKLSELSASSKNKNSPTQITLIEVDETKNDSQNDETHDVTNKDKSE